MQHEGLADDHDPHPLLSLQQIDMLCHGKETNLMQHEGLANDHNSHPLLSLQQMYALCHGKGANLMQHEGLADDHYLHPLLSLQQIDTLCHCNETNLMQHEGLADDHDSHPLLSLQQINTHCHGKEKKGLDGSFQHCVMMSQVSCWAAQDPLSYVMMIDHLKLLFIGRLTGSSFLFFLLMIGAMPCMKRTAKPVASLIGCSMKCLGLRVIDHSSRPPARFMDKACLSMQFKYSLHTPSSRSLA